jgi:hypothetical protein
MPSAQRAQGSGGERLEAALTILCEVAEEQMAMLLALRSQSDRAFTARARRRP